MTIHGGVRRRPCSLFLVATLAAATGRQVRQVPVYDEQPSDDPYLAIPSERAPADAAEDETHAFGVDAAEDDGAKPSDPLMDKFLNSDVGMLASIGINNAARVFGPPDFPKQEAPKDGGYNGGDGTMLPASEELVLRLQANAALELLKEERYPSARCLDGTVGGFYYKAASSSSARDNWLFHLQGGGECDTKRCARLLETGLGSSKFFALAHSFYGENLDVRMAVQECDEPDEEACEGNLMAAMSVLQVNQRHVNPDFYDWNMVFVPYCSQDLWLGQRTAAVRASNDTNDLYFSGMHILDAVIDTLDLTKNMADAQNIVFSGDSAGGYGVLTHLDRLAAKHPNARVVGNPVGGLWGFAHPYRGPRHTHSQFSNFEPRNWNHMRKLWKAYIPKSCPYREEVACSVACSRFPWPWTHIKSPLFIVSANTDTVLATMHNWLPKPERRPNGLHDPHYYGKEEKSWLTRWGTNMTRCLRSGVKYIQEHTEDKFRIGVFSPSCFTHTYFPDDLRIGTKNYMQAFSDFWHQRDVSHVHIEDGLMMNPTCRNQFYSVMT